MSKNCYITAMVSQANEDSIKKTAQNLDIDDKDNCWENHDKKSQSVYALHQQQAKALNLDVMWCDVPKLCDFFIQNHFFFIVSQSLTSNHGVYVLKLMCSACVLTCMRACAHTNENWTTRCDTVNDMHDANIYFEIKVKSLLKMEYCSCLLYSQHDFPHSIFTLISEFFLSYQNQANRSLSFVVLSLYSILFTISNKHGSKSNT